MHLALSMVVSSSAAAESSSSSIGCFLMDELLDHFSFSDGNEQELAVETGLSAATAGGAVLKSANGVWRGRLRASDIN